VSQYNTINVLVCSIIGIAVKLLFGNNYSEDGSNGPASSVLWGYGLVAIAIFFLMFVQTNIFLNTNSGKTAGMEQGKLMHLLSAILNILPTLMMFIILSWIVILNYQFYKQINTGDVSNEYKEFSNMSTVMIIFQLIVLFKYIMTMGKPNSTDSAKNEQEASKYASFSYILAILNLVFVGMMNIIIISFSTDG